MVDNSLKGDTYVESFANISAHPAVAIVPSDRFPSFLPFFHSAVAQLLPRRAAHILVEHLPDRSYNVILLRGVIQGAPLVHRSKCDGFEHVNLARLVVQCT